MLVTCPNCTASLQIDETKATTDRFTIRCPKCQNTIPVQIKNNASDAVPAHTRNWNAPTAVPYQNPKAVADEKTQAPIKGDDLLRLLSATLQKNNAPTPTNDNYRQSHNRVLLCLNNTEQRESTAQILDEAEYSVFLADTPPQATEKIRDEDVDIVIFSMDFAIKFSGASALQQMINSLLPSERRRLFVVAIDDNSQTLNTHEAFLRNLNLIVNTSELNHLPSILTRALRDFHDLYRYYYQGSETAH